MQYRIDPTRGTRGSSLHAQWMSRPDDQKFLCLEELRDQVKAWRDASTEQNVCPASQLSAHVIEAEYESVDGDGEPVMVHGPVVQPTLDGKPMDSTAYAFDQICAVANAPADYMRRLSAPIAALALRDGFAKRERDIQIYAMQGEEVETPTLRAITSPKYGRIFDEDIASRLIDFAGDRWKVPGNIDWGTLKYNSEVDITKENTTLYASDRDLFCFLCDDRNPIEIGKLPNGDPDMVFRGVIVWNSEVGARTLGVRCMYLRGVCQNRNLWGVEGVQTTVLRHTASAPEKFFQEVAPSLMEYANASPAKFLDGVKAARARIIADARFEEDREEQRLSFFMRHGLPERVAQRAIVQHEKEEGFLPVSVWDHAAAVSALARRNRFQADRIRMEQAAGKMLDRIA